MLGPCCCVWVLCEVTRRIFLIIWSLGQRCSAAVIGCFVKSPEGFVFNHLVTGAEVFFVGTLLLCLGAL